MKKDLKKTEANEEIRFEVVHQEQMVEYTELKADDKVLLTLTELGEYILEMGRENEYEITDDWSPFIEADWSGFIKQPSEDEMFFLATSILSVQATFVYRFLELGLKEKIESTHVFGGSTSDDAQVMYQEGLSGFSVLTVLLLLQDSVSPFASYSSCLKGTQDIFDSSNCWLEYEFYSINDRGDEVEIPIESSELLEYNDYSHYSINDGLGLEVEVLSEIIRMVDIINKEEA